MRADSRQSCNKLVKMHSSGDARAEMWLPCRLLYMRVACCWLLHYAGNYTRKEPGGSLRKLTEQQTDLNASQMQIRLARCVVIGLQTAVITGHEFYITACIYIPNSECMPDLAQFMHCPRTPFFSFCFNACERWKWYTRLIIYARLDPAELKAMLIFVSTKSTLLNLRPVR